MIKNESVMSAIARAILEPDTLELVLSTDPAAEAAERELLNDKVLYCRLRLFAGLICRIKHSFLWQHAPLTMRLLSNRGLTLNTFANYARTVKPHDLVNMSPYERSMGFLNHLDRIINQKPYAAGNLAGLSGLVKHELRSLRINNAFRRAAITVSSPDPETMARLDRGSRICLNDHVFMAGYTADPRLGLPCDECNLRAAHTFLLYAPTAVVRIDSSDERYLLQQLTRSISVNDLRSAAAERGISEATLKGFLARYFVGGRLRFHEVT
jgi:hypothetical protein